MSDGVARLAAAVRRLGCTPADAAALLILGVAAAAAVGLLWVLARPPASTATALPAAGASDAPGLALSESEVIVHVAGAVARPGVYTLPGGSRVGEAVEAAGGARRRAVLDGLNLARVLTDGEQVVVPLPSASPGAAPGGAPATSGTPAAAGGATVSLNQATLADLETLPGVGPVLGQRILDHRDAIGGFKSIDELRDVSGIGEKTFQSLAPLVTP